MSQTRTTLPSWLISMVFHLLLVLVLGLTIRLSPPGGTATARTAEVGIVLKHQQAGQQFYETASDSGTSDSATAARTAVGSVAELFNDQPVTDPTTHLPASLDVIGPGALEGGGVGTAIGAAEGPPGNRTLGGKARTGMFGVQGEGYNFVYVLDRSGSMVGSRGNVLDAAKAQLIASLKDLDKTHQFQIIFYNEKPQRFSPSGNPNKLCFATERNKVLAERFIRGIVADGSTEHEAALVAAIKLRPDVIFFLTDADLPVLATWQLEKIHRMAGGIAINTIEFGEGPQTNPNNFLVKLARQNGGKHCYVDVSKLFPMQPR